MRGGLDLCSPSTALKANCLVIRHLYFRSVRGDLQEATVALPDANPYPFEHKIEVFVRFWGLEPPFSGISSTKSGFLCAFALRNPRFRAFQAQNRDFCAHLGSGTLIFGRFEHKIGFFVRFEISMIQDLDPRDNVIAERVNGILLD